MSSLVWNCVLIAGIACFLWSIGIDGQSVDPTQTLCEFMSNQSGVAYHNELVQGQAPNDTVPCLVGCLMKGWGMTNPGLNASQATQLYLTYYPGDSDIAGPISDCLTNTPRPSDVCVYGQSLLDCVASYAPAPVTTS